MQGVSGSQNSPPGADLFAPALADNINPDEAIHDGRKTLEDIGDQFDSGQYDRMVPSTFAAMNLVALAWARIGWARFLQGQLLESIQYLTSSWQLSQSGTVANRLARVLEKENQRDKARHIFALAVAAGGSDAQNSRDQLLRLSASPEGADKEVVQAGSELLQMRTVKLPSPVAASGRAHFALVFDSSSRPERAEFLDGDPALRGASEKLLERDYPVKFPDVSSVKIVRRATLTCDGSGCAVVLLPADSFTP